MEAAGDVCLEPVGRIGCGLNGRVGRCVHTLPESATETLDGAHPRCQRCTEETIAGLSGWPANPVRAFDTLPELEKLVKKFLSDSSGVVSKWKGSLNHRLGESQVKTPDRREKENRPTSGSLLTQFQTGEMIDFWLASATRDRDSSRALESTPATHLETAGRCCSRLHSSENRP